MWQNILVILLIIGLSYLFRQSTSKANNNLDTFDAQLLFILLALSGIVFYKMTYLKYINKKDKEILVVDNKEGFNNLSFQKELNNFSSLNNNNNNFNTNKDSNLEKSINELKEKVELLESNVNNNLPSVKSNVEGKLSSEEIQIKQNNDLLELESKLKDLIHEKTLEGNLKNEEDLKKIPVYNSCYNADGTFNKDKKEVSQEELQELKDTYGKVMSLLTNNLKIDVDLTA